MNRCSRCPIALPFSLPVVFRAQSVGELPGVVNCGGPAASDGARLALVSGRWVSVVLKALSADVALVRHLDKQQIRKLLGVVDR